MKRLIIFRVFAQLIDIFIYLAILIASFINILPIFIKLFNNPMLSAVIILIGTILIYFGLQYPFLKVNQTIGKGFFGIKVVCIDPNRKLTLSMLLQREILAKMMSCYFSCIPVFIGKEAWHDSDETTVTYCTKKKINPKESLQ